MERLMRLTDWINSARKTGYVAKAEITIVRVTDSASACDPCTSFKESRIIYFSHGVNGEVTDLLVEE